MRISRRFTVEENDNGEWGFMPHWIGGAEPFERVAHDMLEHFLVPQYNAAEAELMALGAMLVLRIDGGPRNMTAEQNLALVVEGAMDDWARGDMDAPRPLVSRRMHEHDWADAVIVLAVPKAFAGHNRNFEQGSPYGNELQPHVVSWVRAGVRAAHRRYWPARTSLFDIGQTVMPKLDDFSNRLIGHERVQPGDEVIITADVDTCEFMATVRGRRIDL